MEAIPLLIICIFNQIGLDLILNICQVFHTKRSFYVYTKCTFFPVAFSQMFDINDYSVRTFLFYRLTPNFHVIFHVISFFSANEDVTENKDCESLSISQENFYDRVTFNIVSKVQCSDCNFAIKITHCRFFSEQTENYQNFEKNKKEKKPFLEKNISDGPAS